MTNFNVNKFYSPGVKFYPGTGAATANISIKTNINDSSSRVFDIKNFLQAYCKIELSLTLCSFAIFTWTQYVT